MMKQTYLTPEIEYYEVVVEAGFAVSGNLSDGNGDNDYDGWDNAN